MNAQKTGIKDSNKRKGLEGFFCSRFKRIFSTSGKSITSLLRIARFDCWLMNI
jgi:hypothetical protein